MAASQVVLQSFLRERFTVNFRHLADSKEKGENGKPLYRKGDPVRIGGVLKQTVIPSKFEAPKNIKVLTPEDFEQIREDIEMYLEMGQRKGGIVKIDDIPAGYWDPAQQVADAKGKMSAALAERDGALMKVLELEEQVKTLKKTLISYGWKDE